jgi:dihydroorotate dehydrogenase electron transfer subunit
MDKITVRTAPVVTNEQVAPPGRRPSGPGGPGVFLLEARGSFPAKPAQFYMLKAWRLDPPLFRPMSVFDRTAEGITFLYTVRGRGTDLLSRLSPGDELMLLGPLGNGWEQVGKRIVLVGGGSGIAPLFYTARVFGKADVYLGFQEKPFLLEEFGEVARQVHVSSESGEGGRKGLVTEIFSPDGYDACYACGPNAMLETLSRTCQRAGVPLFVSLEERMACGIGACLGCAVKTSMGMRQVCRDGPVFRADEVIWNG